MVSLGEVVEKIRSKNAGPFWLTIDIFCGTSEVFERVGRGLKNRQLAALFQVEETSIKRFDISDLNVIKISLTRPVVQGSVADRDMHGASWAALVNELELAG